MSDSFSLKGKVALITGGNGFLGQQYVAAVKQAGGRPVILDAFFLRGSDVDSVLADITDFEAIKKAVQQVIDSFSRIDVLINNAALNPAVAREGGDRQWAAYEDFSADLWRREIEVNLTGQMFVTQAVAPVMMKQKSGSIIFISSDLGVIGPNNSLYDEGKFKDIAYCTAKGGVLQLMRCWAAYLGPFNVRVNALAPGGMNNGHSEEFAKKNGALNMLGRMAQPGEFNGPVLFLASEASAFVTGSCLHVDGGRTAW